jgi:ABC-2 type transport system ATP-binding protein
MPAIETSHLTKSFDGKTNAVEDLTLSISPGEIFGCLGPNGAGKTTTVRLLNGILTPGAGTVTILGRSAVSSLGEIHRLCGVMTEDASPYRNLTGWENLLFFGCLQDLPYAEIRMRGGWLLEMFGLSGAGEKKVKAYSSGMKKKISLAITLLHRPQILFLDEPTANLDPEASRDVLQYIRRLAQEEKTTVFLCTHQLKYAEEVCTRYGLLHRGRLLACGRLDELRRQKQTAVRLEIRGEGIPENLGFTRENGGFQRPVADDAEASRILAQIVHTGGKIYEARQKQMSLEELYFAYQKQL